MVLLAGCGGGSSGGANQTLPNHMEGRDPYGVAIPKEDLVSDFRIAERLVIRSDGQEIEPVGFLIYEWRDSYAIINLDAPFSAELSPNLPTITLALDFEVSVTGGMVLDNPRYIILDEDHRNVFSSYDITGMEPGFHTVIIDMMYGQYADEFVQIWYYFNLEVPEGGLNV